jgi:hypothetical protein
VTVQETERAGSGRHRAAAASPETRVRLRSDDTCRLCGLELRALTTVVQDRRTHAVRCLDCDGVTALSAAARHRDDVDDEHVATSGTDVRALLDDLWACDVRALHGRRVPGSQDTIDHVVVSPTGVWVVDVVREAGRPRVLPGTGPFRRRGERLVVGRRSCTRQLDGVLRHADLVRDVLGPDVQVHAALCLVRTDWSRVGAADLDARGVTVLGPRRLEELLTRPGGPELDLASVRRRLAVAFRVV